MDRPTFHHQTTLGEIQEFMLDHDITLTEVKRLVMHDGPMWHVAGYLGEHPRRQNKNPLYAYEPTLHEALNDLFDRLINLR
jgi:hypothetical protein